MTLKICSTVYSTQQGLGLLAKAFFDHGVVTHPVIIQHGRHPNHHEWYPPGTPVIRDLRRDTMKTLEPILRECDVFLAFETPFEWAVFTRCRELGKKSALMPMFECEPKRLPTRPDLFINPSLLDQRYYPEGVFIPVPVEYPWRKRERARVFVHNAGHGGLKGRNGTAELVEAMEHIKSPAKLIIRSQESLYRTAGHRQTAQLTNPLHRRGQRIDYDDESAPRPEMMAQFIEGTVPYETLFADGDVFVFPEGFNGLSLPLQEARAAGMLVMCGDRFPMNTWLPREPLIPVKGYCKEQIGPPYNEYDRAVFDPVAIAAKIDEWYDRDIGAYSEQGREWAETMSWAALKPRYLDVLQRLADGRISPSSSGWGARGRT